ncbi:MULTISPECIES: AraC family transcriptional regulator [unclassified Spirosoma]|uniref:AraC family transcriptional regulator n=1 Tax=unclassified Spirosoma TaxID=2621999 RepID=UPI00095E300E|nr:MULTISPECIES: AraC family transcriptional regulator [unclassified Spirosoma]MBN8822127.1 AraC family transcriptional regulator [Spirosoma sp.]OJW80525.1 MAG: AraC family transcriptional regulator [Spirosoma sp. 48-14]
MKQPLRKDLEPVAASFIVKELVESHFDPNWHFHPHYQLFLVEEGTGTRFIGDSIKPFGPGDLVFLGPNLPHLWRSDQVYFSKQSDLITKGIVVYFADDFLGSDFLKKQEMNLLRQLLNNARQGLEWTGPTRSYAEMALRNLAAQGVGFERILSLLTLLNRLSQATDHRFLTSSGYTNTVKPSETDRMQLVHDYVLDHFPDEISLDTVSDLAGMTPPAFCRYFKARANKTFSEFVSEVRIGHACKLLMAGKLNITQISFESGFRTLSNFNRQFKFITGQTPSSYVRTYRDL